MKIGDVLILIQNNKGEYDNFTVGKYYPIIKINQPNSDDNPIKGQLCGWIKDDNYSYAYFSKENATDKYWKYLKDIRKEKLNKILK